MEHTPRLRAWGRTGLVTAAALSLLVATTPSASAHVSVSASSAVAGSQALLVFSIPHGCDGSPTTQVAIQVPAAIGSVTPTRNAFYSLEVVTEALDEPVVDGHGNEVAERISEVVYTALDSLPDGHRDVLELSVRLPAGAAGSTLYFPTIQTCLAGEAAWIEVPADGQDPHDLAHPAPSLQVVEAAGADHADHGDGPRADGPDAWTWTALGLGALGVVLGGVAIAGSRRR